MNCFNRKAVMAAYYVFCKVHGRTHRNLCSKYLSRLVRLRFRPDNAALCLLLLDVESRRLYTRLCMRHGV